jgi:hypothetical protein
MPESLSLSAEVPVLIASAQNDVFNKFINSHCIIRSKEFSSLTRRKIPCSQLKLQEDMSLKSNTRD